MRALPGNSGGGGKVLAVLLAGAFALYGFMPLAGGFEGVWGTVNGSGPGPDVLNATANIENILLKINETLLEKHDLWLQNLKTRYAYRGDKCNIAADHIASVFRRNGLNVTYDNFDYRGWHMKNVVGTLPGTGGTNGTVIICSHYDSVSSTTAWTEAPGADDNGSGTAAVLAAAEILSDYEFNLTVKFITFGGEELGLKGSWHYAGDAATRGDNITAVINMDMIGYNPDPGSQNVRIYQGANGDSSWLVSYVQNISVKYRDTIGLGVLDSGTSAASDHHPFSAYYQSVMLIEDKFNPDYHTNQDLLDNINLTYHSNVTQLAVATACELAQLNSTDIAPPSHSPGFPPPGGYGQASPTISIEVTDPAGINISSIQMLLDGVPVPFSASWTPLGLNLSHTPSSPFSDGQVVNVSVYAEDMLGHSFAYSWEFTVDAAPPAPPLNLSITPVRLRAQKNGLVLNIESGGPDSNHALAPSVLYEGGEYKMWYAGDDGSGYNICHATSPDGMNWTKHGIVLQKGTGGEADSWDASFPMVMYDSGTYKMWYSGYDGTYWRIMYATSPDGINWTKEGVVIDNGGNGTLDNMRAYSPETVKAGGEYKMWYAGHDGYTYHILYANSSDGVNWSKYPEPVTPAGATVAYGDAVVTYPAVVFDGSVYHMWYNRYDSRYMRLLYANSTDGIHWTDQGLALDHGIPGEFDVFRACYPSVLIMGNETKIWYSGYNNANWRIMYANLTPDMPKTDLAIDWEPSSSPDVLRYEVYKETRPSAFAPTSELSPAIPEYYGVPPGSTPWPCDTGWVSNVSVLGPVSAGDPPFFTLPDDWIVDLSLYIDLGAEGWQPLEQGADYSVNFTSGLVDLSPIAPFEAGWTFYATYNHTASRGLKMRGSGMVDSNAGWGSDLDYYYRLRAVDRAGNSAICQGTVGKLGVELENGWTMVSLPFISGEMGVEKALASIGWGRAMAWDPAAGPNHWLGNVPGRSAGLNTLDTVNAGTGLWVESGGGALCTAGRVHNITINMSAGWNLVAYPYHEFMSVSDALAGLPWDRVEGLDPAEPYLLRVLGDNDMLSPGQAIWVRLTSDAVWTALNA